MDRSQQELHDILAPQAIVYGLDGSRAYEVVVSKTQAEEARRLLKAAQLKTGKLTLYARNARWRESWLTRLVQWTRRIPFLTALWLSRRRAADQRRSAS